MPKTVGDFLRKKRVEEGLSQPQVAQRIGVSLSTIKQWEGNRTEPIGRFHEKALAFLGFNPVNGASDPNRKKSKMRPAIQAIQTLEREVAAAKRPADARAV